MKSIIKSLIVCALVGSGVAHAQQDIHFSQFYSAPTLINPATTGVFNGNIRGMVNYRSQWKSVSEPFTTITAAADARLFEKKDGGFLGLGAAFYNDKAGTSNLTTGNYALSIAYAFQLDKDVYLSLGVQPGLITKSIDPSGLYYGTQFNGLSYDNGIASGENSAAANFKAFDVNAGAYLLYRIDNYSAFYGGLSASHLTRPNISFLGSTDKMLMKYTFHAGAELALKGTNMVILPNTLMKFQGPNRIINIGADFKYVMQQQSHFTGFVNELSAGFGAYYRVGDALWGTLQFNWTGLTVAFSYDLNLSGLSVASNGLGGMEMMIMYRHGIGNGKGKSTRFL